MSDTKTSIDAIADCGTKLEPGQLSGVPPQPWSPVGGFLPVALGRSAGHANAATLGSILMLHAWLRSEERDLPVAA